MGYALEIAQNRVPVLKTGDGTLIRIRKKPATTRYETSSSPPSPPPPCDPTPQLPPPRDQGQAPSPPGNQPGFVTSDYHRIWDDVRRQAREDSGEWRDVQLYRNKSTGGIVLYFGGIEYEGLPGTYESTTDASGEPVVKDSDGDLVPTRMAPSRPPLRKVAR